MIKKIRRDYYIEDCYNDEEQMDILNELDDEETMDDQGYSSNDISELPYRGNGEDDFDQNYMDDDIIEEELSYDDNDEFYPDVDPSTGSGFTSSDISRKTRRELRNAGVDISKLSQDELEALVGFDNEWGDSSNILNPYTFLQSYRRKKGKRKTEAVSDISKQVKAYYDTIELAGQFFNGTNNKKIPTLIKQLLTEIEPYMNM